ncbi:MAG: hypothetical protein K8R74_11885, partial [Bacteroidales bacterium]|nr:hypothetical protein [Bacteroidales bacterium]
IENKEKLAKYSLDIDSVIKVSFVFTEVEKLLKEKETEISICNIKINGNELSKGLLDIIKQFKADLLKEQENLDEPQKKYQKYLNDKKEWELNRKDVEGNKETSGTLRYYQSILDYLNNTLMNVIIVKREKRIEKVKQIFNNKKSIISIYDKTKKGIDLRIQENLDLLENYKINIDASLILNNTFSKRFLGFISQNKLGSFYSIDGGLYQINEIIEGKNLNNVEDVELLLSTIVEYFFKDKRREFNDEDRFIDEQVNNIEGLYDYLFSLDYIDYHYQLKLGAKEIEQLSPGERGALLLIFYLLLDKNDIPLIIDQAEDNLDNHSVANVLVPFIRRAKQKRQIILVTHNPNLAVVADAEQIIWVNIDKENKNKFEYISGSIENKEINKRIVNVLEGAMPAFNKRKQKYYE